jgi:hypothetical protein
VYLLTLLHFVFYLCKIVLDPSFPHPSSEYFSHGRRRQPVGLSHDSIIGGPSNYKRSYSQISRNTTFSQKNGTQTKITHRVFYFSVRFTTPPSLGAAWAAWSAGAEKSFFDFQQRQVSFLTSKVADRLCGAPRLLFSGCRAYFSGSKAAVAWSWPFTPV